MSRWWTTGYEQNVFYVDYPPCESSKSFYEELCSSFDQLKEQGSWTVFNDGSVQSQLWIETFEKVGASFKVLEEADVPWRQLEPFIRRMNQEYHIFQARLLLYAYLSENITGPLLLPGAEIRILNVNYSRVQKKALGDPYYVHVENERFYLLEKFLENRKDSVILNPLKLSPQLFRSYFLTSEQKSWLVCSEEEPHNFWAEQRLFKSLLKREPSPTAQDLRKWQGVEERGMQQAAFPLHQMFRRVLKITPYFNSLAEVWYGSVD